MKPNIGATDRVIRVVAGVGLLAVAVLLRETAYGWLGWFGIVPLISAALGWTPAYVVLGINTRRNSQK